jgi:predicted negative regulator of RcsB-dependent stress response
MDSEGNQKYPILIMGAIFLIAVLCLLYWHHGNQIPSGHDASGHMRTTLWITHAMEDHPVSVYDILRGQPARYTPLTYLFSASLLLLTNYSYWGYILAIVIFWALTLFAMAVVGKQFAKWPWAGLFCMVVLLATPTMWTVGVSINLEASLMAACALLLAMILFADRISSWFTIVATILLTGVFAFSKSVILVPVAPFALLLCLTRDKGLLAKRAMILLSVVAAVGFWLLTRSNLILPEMTTDFHNVIEPDLPGPFYYFLLIPFGFRGLPLLIGLGYVLWLRYKEKDLTIEDYALLAFFLSPFVFFSCFDTRRSWYLLAPYLSLPVLFAYSANRMWESLWVRRVSAVLLIIFSALALFNAVLVASMTGPRWQERGYYFGLRPAKPPTETEIQLADYVFSLLEQDPRARVAVDLTSRELGAARFESIMLIAKPGLSSLGQIVATDKILPNLEHFIEVVPKSRWVVTLGNAWPDYAKLKSKIPGDEIPLLEAHLNEMQNFFAQRMTSSLNDGTQITVFENLSNQSTEVNAALVRYSRLSAQVFKLKEAQDWEGALDAIAELRLAIDPDQIFGINLEEAAVLSHLGRFEEAEVLINKNLKSLNRTDALFAESAFFLSRVCADSGALDQSAIAFQAGLTGTYDKNNLVNTALYLAKVFRKEKLLDRTMQMLNGILGQAAGEQKALIQIELAKVFLEMGREKECRDYFNRAFKTTKDTIQKAWIVDTLEEIDRVGFDKLVFY